MFAYFQVHGDDKHLKKIMGVLFVWIFVLE